MLTRNAKDVWLELRARCSRLQQSHTLIPTLAKNVPTLIFSVDDRTIVRRSANARKADQSSAVPRGHIMRVWEDLAAHDRTTSKTSSQTAYSIVGTLIEVIEYRSEPFRLVVMDPDRANQGWPDPAVAFAELPELRRGFLEALADFAHLQIGRPFGAPQAPTHLASSRRVCARHGEALHPL